MQNILITATDLERLQSVLDLHDTPASDALATELHRATIVDPRAIPADVVTMNSEVVYEDLDTGTRRTVRIVYPHKSNVANGNISVLAPIGSALLGLRVGQTIEWSVPHGRKRVKLVDVRYQPEANGDYQL